MFLESVLADLGYGCTKKDLALLLYHWYLRGHLLIDDYVDFFCYGLRNPITDEDYGLTEDEVVKDICREYSVKKLRHSVLSNIDEMSNTITKESDENGNQVVYDRVIHL